MTLSKIVAPEPGTLEQWFVEEGDVVSAGDPIALLDIQGELRQIRAKEGGIVQALRLAEHAFAAGRMILAILDAFDETGRGKRKKVVADTKLKQDIKAIVEGVVNPQFAGIKSDLSNLQTSVNAIAASLKSPPGRPPSRPPRP